MARATRTARSCGARRGRVGKEGRREVRAVLPLRVRPSLRRERRGLLLGLVLVLALLSAASAHEGEHADPELLAGWRTQIHLLFQWAHLVAFGLWVGGMLAATRLFRLSLDSLLFGSWGLFLVSLGSGSYNMEFSAATSDAPDVLSLPALSGRWEFGDAYIILVGAKQALLGLAVLWTAGVTLRHLRWRPERDRGSLRQAFVAGALALGLTLAAVTSMVLVLHEAIDLAPTPLHSLGGVVGRLGPAELEAARAAQHAAPPPYGTDTRAPGAGFRLFSVPRAAGDALARFGHLVGFAAWLGGNAASLLASAPDRRRVLPQLWLALGVQALTGVYQLVWWTPFAVVPLPWRLSAMADFRFGHTYTLLLALKLVLAIVATAGTAGLTVALRRIPDGRSRGAWALAALNVAVGLVLAYLAIALLLVHEGVDHAL